MLCWLISVTSRVPLYGPLRSRAYYKLQSSCYSCLPSGKNFLPYHSRHFLFAAKIMWKTVQTKLSQKITIFLQFFSFITKIS